MAVYKRNKIWYVYYYVKVNGRHKKKGVAVGSRKDVAEALDKKYREMTKAGIDPTMDQIDLSEIIPEKLPVTKPQGLIFKQFKPIFLELHGMLQSPKMQESYRSSLGHLLPVFGKIIGGSSILRSLFKIKRSIKPTMEKPTIITKA